MAGLWNLTCDQWEPAISERRAAATWHDMFAATFLAKFPHKLERITTP